MDVTTQVWRVDKECLFGRGIALGIKCVLQFANWTGDRKWKLRRTLRREPVP